MNLKYWKYNERSDSLSKITESVVPSKTTVLPSGMDFKLLKRTVSHARRIFWWKTGDRR